MRASLSSKDIKKKRNYLSPSKNLISIDSPVNYLPNSPKKETGITRSSFTRISTKLPCSTANSPQESSSIPIKGISYIELSQIYRAKCKDLQISYLKAQEDRFISTCGNFFKDKVIDLKANGLAKETATIISEIIKKNTHFSQLILSNNYIGNYGAISIGKALKKNKSLIHVDISSNDVGIEGLAGFIELIIENQSVISLNLGSVDRMNRNRMGIKGSYALGKLLSCNSILSYINLSGTGIGKEGLQYIIHGLNNNKSILYLNVSDNLIDSSSMNSFSLAITTTCIKDLVISYNPISSKGCEYLSITLVPEHQTVCNLIRLNLSGCKISDDGCYKLFDALEKNLTILDLTLHKNPLGKQSGHFIGNCLGVNTTVQSLYLSDCGLNDEGVIAMSAGIHKNNSVKKLDLSKNFITDLAVKYLCEALASNQRINFLNLSSNCIKTQGGESICSMLRKNRSIQTLILNENSLEDSTAQTLIEVTKLSSHILKLDLQSNPITTQYINKIEKHLKSNRTKNKNSVPPKIKKEIEKLSIKEEHVQEIFEKIIFKEKEKIDFQKKIEKQKTKLLTVKTKDNQKLQMLIEQKNDLIDKRLKLSKNLECMLLEINKFKYRKDKELKMITANIDTVSSEIKKLEVTSMNYLETYLISEYNANKTKNHNLISELKKKLENSQAEYNLAAINAENSEKKLFDVIAQVETLKIPSKFEEETKSTYKTKKIKKKANIKV
jgi:Ran GTPase-activating protein (RanGAP) involved in mRNA processing and transport